jgi:hypothetical protein
MLRDSILSLPKCSSSFRSAKAPIYSGPVLKYLLSILRTTICWFCKAVNVAALDAAKSVLRTRIPFILGRRLTTSRFVGGLLAGRSDEGRIGTIRASRRAHRRHADEQANGGRCTFIDAESQVEGPRRQCGLHSDIPNRGRGSSVIPSPCDKAAGSCSVPARLCWPDSVTLVFVPTRLRRHPWAKRHVLYTSGDGNGFLKLFPDRPQCLRDGRRGWSNGLRTVGGTRYVSTKKKGPFGVLSGLLYIDA